MKQPRMQHEKGTGRLAVEDADAFKELPNLRGFFLNQTYDGDTDRREPGCLILAARAGLWCATLKEPTACLMLRVSAPTLDVLWLTGEELLAAEDAPWEHDSYEALRRKNSRRRG